MPEGPELRSSADRLRSSFVGRTLSGFKCGETGRYAKAPPPGHDIAVARGRSVLVSVDVHGKFMWWTLMGMEGSPREKFYLMVHYGMSGQWMLRGWSDDAAKHTAYSMDVDYGDTGVLAFIDQRHFGTLRWTSDEDEVEKKRLALGVDLLSDQPVDEVAFRRVLRRRSKKTLAQALMDQSVTSGVGNYVKAEALYAARLSPHRLVGELSDEELNVLRAALIKVLRDSYASGGATIATYRTPDGKQGEAQRRFQVYGHECTPEGLIVISQKTMDHRTTWWCPSVQK